MKRVKEYKKKLSIKRYDMLNDKEMTEVLRRTAFAINSTLPWLSDDKKQELAQIVVSQKAIMEYKPNQTLEYFTKQLVDTQTKLAKCDDSSPCFEKLNHLLSVFREQLARPATIPCIEYLKIIAVRQAYKPNNYIAVKGQRIAMKEQAEMDKVLGEINFDGVESRFNATFQTVSYNQLHTDNGFEPACFRLNPEEAMIEAEEAQLRDAEEALQQQMISVTRKNPFFEGWLKAVTEHFEAGGNMKSFAAKFGMSGQTAINRIKRMVNEANSLNTPMLPFEAVEAPAVVPVIPTRKQTKKTTTTNNDQLTLF